VSSILRRTVFFVEFGATNGVALSNSWLLENQFAWKGSLAEPAKKWHAELKKIGTVISQRIVFGEALATN